MNTFIAGNCKADQKIHTRVGECSMFEGKPNGFIIHNKNGAFPLGTDAFNTALKSGITAPGINRITPLLGGIVDYQITGGDVATNQEGFGPENPIGLNAKRVDYIIDKGGLCLLRQLKKLNGRQIRIILVDKNNVAYGTASTVGGEDKFRGFLATIWAAKRDNNGTQTGAIILSVFYDANYEHEESNLTSIAITEELEGLTGVVLKRANPGYVKFVIACSGDDLTDTYGDALAEPSLYKDESGNAPQSVTYKDGELAIMPAGKYAITDAETLKTAGIEGYEGEEIYESVS